MSGKKENMIANSASEENARQILIDWFQRHPLTHSLKVKFTNTVEDAGDGTSYLLYEMYIKQEKYGILKVNPDSGEIIMDRGPDYTGTPAAVQTTMDQWYLKYYWGWTDDSGYYSQQYDDDQYTIYNGDDAPILEYHIKEDSYFICNFDLQCLIEYDDGTAASGIDLSDFAGTYGYDASIGTADITGNFYYLLEIGEWDGCCLSITESWRGNELIHDDWATPESLVVDTLTLRVYDPNEACYKTHTLKYIPAEHSSYGQDVIYLDGDESMPYIRE